MRAIPIIILEGSDYSGKTSLSEELVEMWMRIKQPYGGVSPTTSVSHNGPPPDRREDESSEEYSLRLQSRLVDQIDWYRPENSMHLHVVDRCHLGSYVYGNLFRPGQSLEGWGELGRTGFARVDRAYAAKGAVLAVLVPSSDTLILRSGSREDEYLDSLMSGSAPNGQIDSDSHSASRMRQIIQISQMYGVFVRQYAPLFETYAAVGHPYYVPIDHEHGEASENWPDISYNQDKRSVAADLLGKAIEAQLSVMAQTKIVMLGEQNDYADSRSADRETT